MRRRCTRLLSVLSVVLMTGCANGYKQFYTPNQTISQQDLAERRQAPPPVDPIVVHANLSQAKETVESYVKSGYSVIGSSMFNSGDSVQERGAVDQARAVGADLVIVYYPKITGTQTSAIPITTPSTSTTYSTGTATAYGAGGPVTAYGSGTSTTYGSSTTWVPITVTRADYGAVYMAKLRVKLGAFFRDLNDSERQVLQSNKGAAIVFLVDNSPAFNADFLVGDFVLAIDGVPVINAQSLLSSLKTLGGKTVTFTLMRQGKRLDKVVHLNQ